MTYGKRPSLSLPFDIDWPALAALLEMVRYDPDTETLSIRNGDSRITLAKDGTIRAEGRRLIQSATEDISLNAAWIDLN